MNDTRITNDQILDICFAIQNAPGQFWCGLSPLVESVESALIEVTITDQNSQPVQLWILSDVKPKGPYARWLKSATHEEAAKQAMHWLFLRWWCEVRLGTLFQWQRIVQEVG